MSLNFMNVGVVGGSFFYMLSALYYRIIGLLGAVLRGLWNSLPSNLR